MKLSLTKGEIRRYSRHLILKNIGIEGQLKLKKSNVFVVGAGGLGSSVLTYLTAAGVGNIGIADYDTVEESNLQRQILYDVNDLGKSKVEVAVKKLSKQNPLVKFDIYNAKITKENALDIIRNYDIVVDGCDNFSTRYLINDACVILNKIFVYGAIFQFEGQVSVFNYKNGPTYRCLYPEPPDPTDMPNCSEIGVFGAIPGLVGTIQANETIKIITGTGDILSGKLFTINALNFETNIFNINKFEANSNIKELGNYDYTCEEDSTIKEISVVELKKMMDNNEDLQIIDIREPNELIISTLGGELIPMEEIFNNIEKISKAKPAIFICRNGHRSRFVIKLLQENYDYKNLFNLRGGLNDWADLIDKSMTKY